MNSTRLIAAIDLTAAEERALHCITYDLRSQFKDGYTYDEGLYHITLHLFEETPEEKLKDLQRVLKRAAAEQAPFMLVTGKPSIVGDPKSATIWISLTDGQDALTQLHDKLGKKLGKAGFAVESVTDAPHITIGRYVDTTKFETALDESTHPSMSLYAQALTLLKRTITDGIPTYEPLFSAKFSGK